MKVTKFILILAFSLMIVACGGSDKNKGGGLGPASTIDYAAIRPEHNLQIAIYEFKADDQLYKSFKSSINLQVDDYEVHYTLGENEDGWIAITSVSNGSSPNRWNIYYHEDSEHIELGFRGRQTHECKIAIRNREISELEGSCNIRVRVYMPSSAKIEVYNSETLRSRRFFGMEKEEFFTSLRRTPYADDKIAVIKNFLNSYNSTQDTLEFSSKDLGDVLKKFYQVENKLQVLSILHSRVSDRQNLKEVIDDNISYFDRERAYKIVGI